MANPVEGAAAGAKAAGGFVKNHPVVTVVIVVVLALIAIRFRKQIVSAISGVPLVGGRVAGVAGAGATTG